MIYDDVGNHPNFVALRESLLQHPDLYALCALQPDFESIMAEIAAYCDILLDGAYTQDEIIKLVGILAERLVSKNTLIIPVGFNPEKVVEHGKDLLGRLEESNDSRLGSEGSVGVNDSVVEVSPQSEHTGASDGSNLLSGTPS